MILIIFIEGIMIIDQEIRINAIKKKAQEVTGEVEKTIERANQFISTYELAPATSSQATSSDIIE